MPTYAVLIDGGFVRRKLGTSKRHANADDIKNLVDRIALQPALAEMRLHRIYYYDSTPLDHSENKPLGGGLQKFGEGGIVQRMRSLFEQLAQQPFTALRLGELTFSGWTIKARTLDRPDATGVHITADDLQPKISQKGVDMRIGMDIAALTLKKQATVIVLVTGDSDFVPAMKFARREGAQLYLCTLGHRVKVAMLEHSDMLLELLPTERTGQDYPV